MKTRSEIKNEAKGVVKKNFKKILIGLIPATLAFFVMFLRLGMLSGIAEIVWGFILYGILCACLNGVNNGYFTDNLFKDSFGIFNKKYFWPTIKLIFMVTILIIAWSFLLIIPGIIKAFAYSQSFFIMKEHIDNGEKVTARQCITESRQLMDGQKGKFFTLVLSFIGWTILGAIAIGFSVAMVAVSNIFIVLHFIALLFYMVLIFYIYYSQAIFYKELTSENK